MRTRVATIVVGGLLVVWLGIGALFALQNGYFDEDACSTWSDNVVAVLLGPVNLLESDPAWGMCVTAD
ncbi:MAG: hypothetical protein LT071_04220 [Nocardioides sp.]|nr:hypothetical protein [Nocardioides sp.]